MYTSPSPLPRRAPLRLPFSVHIRKLFFLFSQLRSLHHPPLIPHLSHRRSGHAPRRGRRPRRPAHVSSMSPTGRVPRSGATPFCPRRQKGAKTPPKTNGFWISLFRLQLHHKKVPQRIACTSIPAAAPTPRAAALCSPNIKIGGPRGRTCTCRQRRQVRDLIIAQIGRPANLL